MERFEAEAKANFDRWSVSVLYGDYAAQPDIGYLTRREGVLVSGSVKLATNWVATGAARWDLVANQINQYVVGAGYVDDCFVLAANYVTSYSYATATSPPILGHAFMLQTRPAHHCQFGHDGELGSALGRTSRTILLMRYDPSGLRPGFPTKVFLTGSRAVGKYRISA